MIGRSFAGTRFEWLLVAPWRLTLVVALGLALPLLLLTEGAVRGSGSVLQAERQRATAVGAERAAELVNVWIGSLRQRVAAAASLPDLTAATRARDMTVLVKLLDLELRRIMPVQIDGGRLDISGMTVFDKSGEVIFGSGPGGTSLAGPMPGIADQPYFRALREQTQTLVPPDAGDVHVTGITKVARFPSLNLVSAALERLANDPIPQIVLAAPIKFGLDPLAGILVAQIDPRSAGSFLQVGGLHDLYLVDGTGKVIVRASDHIASINGEELGDLSQVERALRGETSVADGTDPASGAPGILATAQVPQTGWVVLAVRTPTAADAAADAALQQQRLSGAALALILLLGSALVGISTSRSIRRRDALAASLEQQTAIGEVLRVISTSPFDLERVFKEIAASAVRLCGADNASIVRIMGDRAYPVAHAGIERPGTKDDDHWAKEGIPIDRSSVMGRVVMERASISVGDIAQEPGYVVRDLGGPGARLDASATFGVNRSMLGVPLRQGDAIAGVILLRRNEVKPFRESDVRIVEIFADQAVIAIENVRLFNETKEALEQQTAVAEILKTISRSAFDLEPVLRTLVETAARLVDADLAWMRTARDGEIERLSSSASYGRTPELHARLQPAGDALGDGAAPPKDIQVAPAGHVTGIGHGIGQDAWWRERVRKSVIGLPLETRRTLHVPDLQDVPELLETSPTARFSGSRTVLSVPLLSESSVLGVMVVTRVDVRPFTDREIALVETFADQAAIAMKNVRLFSETKEALEQQTATAEVLKVISRSTFDLQPVLDAVLENAARLSRADMAWMARADPGGPLYAVAGFGMGADNYRAPFKNATPEGQRSQVLFRCISERRTISITDVTADPDFKTSGAARTGARSLVAVPMIREGVAIGGFAVARRDVRAFAPAQIALVETFADQAAIAIENARLLTEIQDKSRQLETASRHKSEFLANMSHELRTPLNAIIGFSDVLLEGMSGALDDRQREYVADIKSSGEHQLSLINDILDLSKVEAGRMELDVSEFGLSAVVEAAVALVKERATRRGVSLSVDVPETEVVMQADQRKIKQVLLNLLSNAVKFTPDGGWVGVTAKVVGGIVQVSVRDTGIGIAPEDRERVFEEFRQAGASSSQRPREGTGLGLALSKRFVELHGGRLRLESEVGKGSSFTLEVPLRRPAAHPVTA